MKIVAILGPTASGKSDVALHLATRFDAIILSLDSLSLYKQIDIISAKPSKEERSHIIHFGIDEVYPHQHFNAFDFIKLFEKTKEYASIHHKNIIIVGGSGFYLKALLDGITQNITINKDAKQKAKMHLQKGYELIQAIDSTYADKISHNDTYRIQKWLEIYFQYGQSASQFFEKNPPSPNKTPIKLYEIALDKETISKKIHQRTSLMIQMGAIDEVAFLEKKYTRVPKSMHSIGIKEILGYFDGIYTLQSLKEAISHNTIQLAKRQVTFNKSQFHNVTQMSKEQILGLESL